MSYKSIHIPFNSGQDEGIDIKLLPEGKFRAARNMVIERDGRMVRRNETSVRPMRGVASPYETQGEFLGTIDNDGIIFRDEDGRTRTGTWVSEDGVERFLTHDGVMANDANVTHVFSGWDNRKSGYQMSPEVAIDSSGNVVFAYVTTTTLVIEIREPGSLSLIKRIEHDDFISISYKMLTVKLAGSTESDRVAAVVSWSSSAGGGAAQVVLQETSGSYNSIKSSASFFTNPIALPPLYDVCAKVGYDQFLLIHTDGTTAYYIDDYDFTPSPTLDVTWNRIYTGTHSWPWSVGLSIYCDGQRIFWGVVGTDSTTVHPVINSRVIGATSAPLVLSAISTGTDNYGDYAFPYVAMVTVTGQIAGRFGPPMFGGRGSNILITYAHYPNTNQDIQSSGYSAMWVLGFDPVNNTAIRSSYLTDIPVAPPVEVTSSQRSSFIVATEPVYISDDDLDSEFEVGGTIYSISFDARGMNPAMSSLLVKSGASVLDSRNWYSSSPTATYSLPLAKRKVAAKPVRYFHNDEWITIHVAEILRTDSVSGFGVPGPRGSTYNNAQTMSCVWIVSREGRRVSSPTRNSEVMVSGGTITTFDGRENLCQFIGPPKLIAGNAGVRPLADVNFLYTFVFEFSDSNGRLWRSAPSVIRSRITGQLPKNVFSYHVSAPLGLPSGINGARVVLYSSNNGVDPVVRRGSWGIGPGGYINPDTSTWFEVSVTNELLYTLAGEVQNAAPPACRFMARGRNRILTGGLDRSCLIQASKLFSDYEAIGWSNLDNFFISLPDEVTGLAAMDDAFVAFTVTGVFVIHGGGPDNSGNGAFPDPQLIPSDVGCIDPLSVISTGNGVFFLSQRGIELIPRGFGSPIWIGQSVRDTLEEFPICLGATVSRDDSLVRWLFGDKRTDPTRSIVIAYDTYRSIWFSHEYESANFIGTVDLDKSRFLVSRSRNLSRIETELDHEAGQDVVSFVETGDIRLSGIQGWMYGRRINLLGTWGGRACDVTIHVAFDGAGYLDEDQFTWRLDSSEFSPGATELELTLPVQLFSAIRAKVKVVPVEDGTLGTMKLSGISLFYDSAPEGPRLGERNAG